MPRYFQQITSGAGLGSGTYIKKVDSAFCNCPAEPYESTVGKMLSCSCGEEQKVYDWSWDVKTATTATRLKLDNREIHFHPGFSNGTAVIRGNQAFAPNFHYYWEIKILTPLYGTDVMIGVGTNKVDLQASLHEFCSLLGSDEESWGYSYLGFIQHDGKSTHYGQPFGQGSIIGVHLDMWDGVLQFYLNRKPLGVAFTSLHGRILYPMICSTAAKSAMRITYCSSIPSSLEFMCLQSLSRSKAKTRILREIPYLRLQIDRQYWWMFPQEGSKESSDTDTSIEDDEDDYDLCSLASVCARSEYLPRTNR